MLKLIKLEMIKIRFGDYIKRALFTNIIIIGIMLLLIYASKADGDLEFSSYSFVFDMSVTLIKAVFIIFASVILSKLVIDEYKNNTISLLFTYPIKRKKLMLAKLIIVVMFTFIAVIVSSILVDSALYIANHFYEFTSEELTINIVTYNLAKIGLYALAAAFIGLVPLFVGMRKKSVPSTIVTAVIIVSLTTSNSNGFSLDSIIAIPIILSIIGVVFAYLTIRNIEHVDITN